MEKITWVRKGVYNVGNEINGLEIEAETKIDALSIYLTRKIEGLRRECERTQKAGELAVEELLDGLKIHSSNRQPVPVISLETPRSCFTDNTIPTREILFKKGWRPTGGVRGNYYMKYLAPIPN